MARRRKARAGPKLIALLGLVFLIAGFVARRTLSPRALTYLPHRLGPPAVGDASQPGPVSSGVPAPSARHPESAMTTVEPAASAPGSPSKQAPGARRENLTGSDRRALDELLRRKNR